MGNPVCSRVFILLLRQSKLFYLHLLILFSSVFGFSLQTNCGKRLFFGGFFFCLFILRVFEQSLMFSDATGGQQLQTTAEDTSWTFSCSQASRSVEVVGKSAHFQQLTEHLASYSWKDCATQPKASELAVCRLHPSNASLLAGVCVPPTPRILPLLPHLQFAVCQPLSLFTLLFSGTF